MAKLEGFSKVAVVKYGGNEYHFAIYDDGFDYRVGDTVVFSNGSTPAMIEDIITAEEEALKWSRGITAEVIAKIDMTAYRNRVSQRKAKEELKKKLDKRRKEIQQRLDDEYYASQDEEFFEMLREYSEL